MDGILKNLVERQLVIALTPPGRGQIFTHNLYMPEELESVRAEALGRATSSESVGESTSRGAASPGLQQEVEVLRSEVAQLREALEQLSNRVGVLES